MFGDSTSGSGSSGNTNGQASNKASANIIYYMKGIEGFAPNYYHYSVNVLTLGYGMTNDELNGVSVPISEPDATIHLRDNTNRFYYTPIYNNLRSKGITPLQREIDAFVSFAYNEGVGALLSSTLYRLYCQGIRDERIHNEFKKWTLAGGQHLPGLIRRREEEWRIFSNQGNVNGYYSRPYINYIDSRGNSTSRLVETNGGYGANPY